MYGPLSVSSGTDVSKEALMRWYQVFRGTKRFVVAVPAFGVVLKFPRFNWLYIGNFFADTRFAFTEIYPRQGLRGEHFRQTIHGSWRRNSGSFFGGIADNYRERRYYKHSDHLIRSLLQPTYVSLIGLLNVQRLGVPSDDMAVYHACYLIIGQDIVFDGHHWDTPSNFDVSSECLVVLDYGSLATQKIIDKHAKELYLRFNLAKGKELKEKYAAARAARENKNPG